MSAAAASTLSNDERALVIDYRAALQNDQAVLAGVLRLWPKLSPAQRAELYRVADLFVSAGARQPWPP